MMNILKLGLVAACITWVGSAMAACPEDTPWHRVINAQGKISLRGGGDSAQRVRLEDEGVIFDERGRVNLKEYQWNGIPI